MKTLILAAAVGLVAFAPSMLPGSTAQTAHAQKAVNDCAAKVMRASKGLRVSPKFATQPNAANTCRVNSARPVLSTAEFLRRYVVAAKIGARKPTPELMKACPGMTRQAIVGSGANPKAASAENVKRACAAAKGRPVMATAGFLGRMTAGVRCVDRTVKSFRALQLNPKNANPKSAQTACKNAKNRPVIAVRNYLARITKGAK